MNSTFSIMTTSIVLLLVSSLLAKNAISQEYNDPIIACTTSARIGQEVVKLEFAIESADGVVLWRTNSIDQPLEIGGRVLTQDLIDIQVATSPRDRAMNEKGIVGRVGPSAIRSRFFVIDRESGNVELDDEWSSSTAGKLVAKFSLFYGSRGNLALLENDFSFGYRLVTIENYFKWPAMLGSRDITNQTLVKHAITTEDGKASFSKMPVAVFDSHAYFNIRNAWQPDVKLIVIDQSKMELCVFEGVKE